MQKQRLTRIALLIGAVVLLAAAQTKASFTFDLGTGNAAISGFSGPYAQVNVNLTSSTTATITFTSLTSAGNIYLFGDGGTVVVNVNGSYTLGTVSESNAGIGFTPTWNDNTPGT